MALINCPECNKEISSHAKSCIHCGYPIEELVDIKNGHIAVRQHKNNNTNICIIDGVSHDLTEIKNELIKLPTGKLSNKDDKDKLGRIQDKLCYQIDGFSIFAAIMLTNEIRNSGEVPASFNAEQYAAKFKQDDGLIHCPRCDSTNVVTGQRGYSMMWGFIGSNRTMNRCAKCGHKWEPRK